MNQENIPVIILCGGIGTRLKEETEFKPKPMVQVGENPILWHIMKIYAEYGFRNFVLALGFKGDYITNYFKEKSHLISDFNVVFSDTGLETPHGERVLKLKKHINSDLFMVTYGDGVADINIEELLRFHKQKGKIATITGVHPISRWGFVRLDGDDVITQFDQKPCLYDYINGGFMVFKKSFFDFLRQGDMIEDGLKRLISQRELAMYRHDNFWYGMDTYRDFIHLNELWKKNPKWKIWQD